MKYSIKYGLQPADRIIEPIFATGFSKHHVIYMGADHQGIEWIAENYKFIGVRMITASEYFKKDKLIKVQKFKGNFSDRISAVKRALLLMGKPYDLIDFNCEHYAEFVQNGRSISNQVEVIKELAQAAAAIFLIVGLINLIRND